MTVFQVGQVYIMTPDDNFTHSINIGPLSSCYVNFKFKEDFTITSAPADIEINHVQCSPNPFTTHLNVSNFYFQHKESGV